MGGGHPEPGGDTQTCLCRQTANLTGADQLTVLASGVRQEQVALGQPSWTSEFTVPWLQGKQKLPDYQMVQDQTLVSGSLLQESHLPLCIMRSTAPCVLPAQGRPGGVPVKFCKSSL